MTKQAIRVVDDPAESARRNQERARQARKAARKGNLAGKTFEDLSNPEKDVLLKELAIRAGLIDDSD